VKSESGRQKGRTPKAGCCGWRKREADPNSKTKEREYREAKDRRKGLCGRRRQVRKFCFGGWKKSARGKGKKGARARKT